MFVCVGTLLVLLSDGVCGVKYPSAGRGRLNDRRDGGCELILCT